MKNRFGILVILAVSTLTAARGVGPPTKEPPPFKITTKKPDDRVEIDWTGPQVNFAVKSPSGISHAVIERLAEKWPQMVTLRLHLKGLESFEVSNGPSSLHASVSAHEGKPKVRLWKDSKENTPLDDKSPLWMEVKIVGKDGKPADKLPLEDGYLEMTLPKTFFEGNPNVLKLSWIDFYR